MNRVQPCGGKQAAGGWGQCATGKHEAGEERSEPNELDRADRQGRSPKVGAVCTVRLDRGSQGVAREAAAPLLARRERGSVPI
jgi:hypothetical protein